MPLLRIAHRAAAGDGPGNTLAAVERALTMNVDLIEIDVQPTSDGHLVVFHDRFLSPATNGYGQVTARSLDEIRQIRTRDGLQPIPTLRDVLDRINGRKGLIIELKTPGTAQLAVATVRESSFEAPLFYASFLHTELIALRGEDQSANTIALLEGSD